MSKTPIDAGLDLEARTSEDLVLEERVLSRARGGLGPSPAQRRHALQQIASTLALPVGADPSDSPPEAAPEVASPGSPTATGSGAGSGGITSVTANPPALAFSLKAMIAGVIAGASVGFAAGSAVSWSDPTPTTEHAPVAVAADVDLVESVVDPEPAVLVSDEVELVDDSLQGPPKIKKRPASKSTPVLATTDPARATLHDELSFVRRAQSALKNGQAALALGLMKDLDQSSPRGALLAERNVTKVLALCQLGRREEATAVARRLLRGNGDADLYRRRLSTSCAELDVSISR